MFADVGAHRASAFGYLLIRPCEEYDKNACAAGRYSHGATVSAFKTPFMTSLRTGLLVLLACRYAGDQSSARLIYRQVETHYRFYRTVSASADGSGVLVSFMAFSPHSLSPLEEPVNRAILRGSDH